MTASPSPLRAATTGSSTGSAYGATKRITTCAPITSAASQPPYPSRSVGTSPSTPRPTAAYAPMPTASARISRNSSAPRRRRCTKPISELFWAGRWAGLWVISLARALDRFLPGGEVLHLGLGVDGVVVDDALAHPLRLDLAEAVDLDVRALVRLREVEPGDLGVQAAVDDDVAVLLAHVVLVLAPRPGHRERDPEQADHDKRRQDPPQPLEPARLPRCVARLLGVDRVAGDRERHAAGERVEDLGLDRLELAGVAGAVAAEEAGHAAHRAALLGRARVGRGADEERLVAQVGGVVGDHVGDQAGDVVGAAGLQAGAHHLDGRVVGAAGAEDVGEPPVVEDAARAVAAQQDPVPDGELDDEQVRLGLVDAVQRLEDEVPVRVDPGL